MKNTLAEAGVFLLELVKVVVLSLAIIIPIRYYVVQPFYVSGQSMEPTFLNHEYLLIDELTYRFDSPQRGDVIVFHYPRDPSKYFIKRLIGLPGETVIITNGQVTIQNQSSPEGFILEELYLQGATTMGDYSVKVSPDTYFLLGDNRNESLDSRIFGPVPVKNIVGRVWLRAFPLNRWTIFNGSVFVMAN